MYNEKKHIKLSIDIGSSFTKYIALQCVNGSEHYLDAKITSTPAGIFDEEGNIADKEKLEAFLDSILYRVQSVKTKHKNLKVIIYLSLSYIENISTHFTSPYYENKDFDKEIKDIISTSNQYDNNKFIFNYSYKNEIATPLAVCDSIIVGYDRNMINFYLKFFDNRNIFVQSISLGTFAIVGILPKENYEETFRTEYSLLIDLGAKSTEVILLKNEFPLNYFVVNRGGNDITNTIQEHYNVSKEEAEEIKISLNENYCIYQDDGIPFPDNQDAADIIELLDPMFKTWEIKMYQDINAELKLQKIPFINKVYVTGGSSYIKNFPESIAALFNAELIHLHDGENIFDSEKIDKIKREADIIYYNMNSFLPVLSHLNSTPLNLINPDYIKNKQSKLPVLKIGNFVLATSLALLIGANAFGYLQNATNNQNISNINSEMSTLSIQYQQEKQKVAKYDALDSKVTAFENALNDKIKFSELMRKIYEATPEGIQIIEVHEIGDGQLEIVGNALDYKLVGVFGKLLQKDADSSALIDAEPVTVTHKQVELTNGSKYQMVEFVIRGEIHPNNLIQ